MSKKIEFYKNRSISDRFSVAIDFLKQNWKVLYKNILLGGLPLALIMGFLTTWLSASQLTGNVPGVILPAMLAMLISFLIMIYMYSMTCSILFHYERDELTETTGWDDLKDTFSRFAGKTVLISVFMFFPVAIISGLLISTIIGSAVVLSAGSTTGALAGSLLLLFILLVLFAVFAPSFTMLYFPAYFSDKGILQSIIASFVLGFKNWGSLFVAIILASIVLMVAYLIFSMPHQVIALFSRGNITVFSYFFAALSAIGTMLTYPAMILIFAFQYFSIVEKEEGISLQSQLNEFENL